MQKPPIFVVGVRRSGTTLLCLMLNSNSRLHITYESGFLPSFHRDLDSLGDLEDPVNIRKLLEQFCAQPRNWGPDDYPNLETVIENIREYTLNGIFDAFYQEIANKKGKARWGDKTPDFALKVDVLSDMFPTAKFIHIVRDCRDVILSRQKISWYKHDIRTIANEWLESVEHAETIGKSLGENRYKMVRYEDLIEDPIKQLKSICLFLEENFEEDMLKFYQEKNNVVPKAEEDRHGNTSKSVMTNHVQLWKKQMPSSDIAIIQSIIEEQLIKTGYDVSTQIPTSTALRRLYYLFIHLIDRIKLKKV